MDISLLTLEKNNILYSFKHCSQFSSFFFYLRFLRPPTDYFTSLGLLRRFNICIYFKSYIHVQLIRKTWFKIKYLEQIALELFADLSTNTTVLRNEWG